MNRHTLADAGLAGNSANWLGGGAYESMLSNCTLTANSADTGGGASSSTLYNCTLTGNLAAGTYAYGGGAYDSTLDNCTLTDNSATGEWSGGGGAAGSTLNDSTLSENWVTGEYAYGGGAHRSTLHNCKLTGNSAEVAGGGARWGTLYNCVLSGNSAGGAAGGASASTLYNCTITGNSADNSGGGVQGYGANHLCSVYNCIVYFNTAPEGPNYGPDSLFNYSCTTPLLEGEGNITNEPVFVDLAGGDLHLALGSPCIDTGTNLSHLITADLDGNPRPLDGDGNGIAAFDMGAYEYDPKTSITLQPASQVAVPGATVGFQVSCAGLPPFTYQWRKDGRDLTDDDRISGATSPTLTIAAVQEGDGGSYDCVVSNAYGALASEAAILTLGVGLYVWQESPNPTSPYTNWATAAHTIQEAVDAAVDGDTVLVTNGVYATGGRAVAGAMTNRVAVDRAITLRSLNGPEFTVIGGGGAIRCAYVGNDAILSGFTLTNGHTRTSGDYLTERSGGGAWCEPSGVVTNCLLTGNSANGSGGGAYGGTLYHCTLAGNSATYGGGAYSCTLNNCTLSGNSASYGGGGARGGTLYNCTLSGNSADFGGGVYRGTLYNCTVAGNSATDAGGAHRSELYNCTITGNWATNSGGGVQGYSASYPCRLYNCIVYYNTAPEGPEYGPYSYFSYSCTTPLPDGEGNITNEPVFVNLVGGDLHLLAGSPCIDAGTNLSHLITTDLDGNPRPWDGNGDGIAAFDMGAYEHMSPAQRVEALIARVLASGLAHNRTNPLVATLAAAQASFARESLRSGVNELGAFQNKVQAQVAPADEALAAAWIAAAQGIIDAVRASAGLRIEGTGAKTALVWRQGVLQEADALEGPWRDVRGAGSPHEVGPVSGRKFYRVKME